MRIYLSGNGFVSHTQSFTASLSRLSSVVEGFSFLFVCLFVYFSHVYSCVAYGFRQQDLAASTDPKHKLVVALQLGEVNTAVGFGCTCQSKDTCVREKYPKLILE